MKCEVDGVKYKSKPNNGNGCNGCAGQGDGLCSRFGPCPNIIWVEAKPRMKVDGKTYKAVKEVGDTCEGCVTAVFSDLCNTLRPNNECYEKKIIWIEKKPKKPAEPAKTVAWVNICSDVTGFHYPTVEEANEHATADRLACVKIEY